MTEKRTWVIVAIWIIFCVFIAYFIASYSDSERATDNARVEAEYRMAGRLADAGIYVSSDLEEWYPYGYCAKLYAGDELAEHNFVNMAKNAGVSSVYYGVNLDGEIYFSFRIRGENIGLDAGVAYSTEHLNVWRWWGLP